jgi:hypothetical protein
MKSRDELASCFLGELEMAEARLLAWGMVDGVASRQELIDRADAFLRRENGWTEFSGAEDLVDELAERRALINLADFDPEYRTRFGETLRLLARLKQLFPNHLHGGDGWLAAPTLVADFRVLLRPRSYPLRNVTAAEVLAECCPPDSSLTPLQRNVLSRLLGIEGGTPGFPLAAFQKRATSRILEEVTAGRVSGSMVCAGTGSGKTLAFYLPALTHIVGTIQQDRGNWVRALALYPRKELLKDQFTECLRMAQKVNVILRNHRIRPLRIGALYGDTPRDKFEASEDWVAEAGGNVCPSLACPKPDCSGKMIWPTLDRTGGMERLRCSLCGSEVRAEEIALTRNSINSSKPDILFTTTEMLNQRLSDSSSWGVFGVVGEPSRRPSLMLLDEAHTYAGTHGAQVAYLLRRWRHRTGCTPHIVGLSATLMDAGSFFAQLTGVPEHLVEEVSPEEGEMTQEGMEYMVALRGDPVSGTSLLSTTIQSAILMRRMLDLDSHPVSRGLYGSKLFVFTDNLDVIHRLFFSVLDAEGQRLDWRRNPVIKAEPLAALRSSDHERVAARQRHGQLWKAAEEIGHELKNNVRVGRVCSMDSGVDADAEIIVATASLEVGFNDPAVGAVLQHKAPRSAATFLQRKGRAGRRRSMRPWLVVVLSDYGRDRLAYSGYDLLFDPELLPQTLPISNRHVLKMQGVYSFLDWLGERLETNVWYRMSRPSTGRFPIPPAVRNNAIKILKDVLTGGDDLQSLETYLQHSLQITAEEVQLILWEAPRGLLTTVLPTLLRRLRHNWMSRGIVAEEYYIEHHPLPEFIPRSLFSDLNLPEIEILATMMRGEDETPNSMPAAQALREFAPGRISRRFGLWSDRSRHWIPVDLHPERQQIQIDAFCGDENREFIADYPAIEGPENTMVAVYRPFALRVSENPPQGMKDSSNAFMEWRTRLAPPEGDNAGVPADLPSRSSWSAIFQELRFFTHQANQPARCCRYSIGSRAELQMDDGTTHEVAARFAVGAKPAALGFEFEMDAIRARVRIPETWDLPAETIKALRAPFFRWRLMEEKRLDGVANFFQRQWIAEIVISALSATAMECESNLECAWEKLRSHAAPVSLNTVLDVIFQSVPSDADDSDPDSQIEQKRHTELTRLLNQDDLLAVLSDLVPLLWGELTHKWDAWLCECFLSSIGSALQSAIQQLCPELDVSDLLIDVESGFISSHENQTHSKSADIWISEQSPGGGGVIERLLPRITEDPRRFIDLLSGALSASDFEVADTELTRLVSILSSAQDDSLRAAVRDVRSANSQGERITAFDELHRQLRMANVNTTHAVMAAVSGRILRPGSTDAMDSFLFDVLDRWRKEETRLGIEIDARALSFVLSDSDSLDRALGGAGNCDVGDLRQWRFSTTYGLLWPRGPQMRNYSLSLYNPYSRLVSPERLLLRGIISHGDPEVFFGSDHWREELALALSDRARAVLVGVRESSKALRENVLFSLVNPIDTGTLLQHPRIRGVLRREGDLLIPMELTAPGQIEAQGAESETRHNYRLILKSSRGSRDEARDLVESLLSAEMLAPGPDLWLVSPWITDINLLDNRSGGYAGLEPDWPKRMLTLAELLAYILKASPQTKLRVVTRPDQHNLRFIRRLKALCQLNFSEDRLLIDANNELVHVKGFAGSSFALTGSMNFTYNGIEVLEETVTLETEPHRVSSLLLNFGIHYPLP